MQLCFRPWQAVDAGGCDPVGEECGAAIIRWGGARLRLDSDRVEPRRATCPHAEAGNVKCEVVLGSKAIASDRGQRRLVKLGREKYSGRSSGTRHLGNNQKWRARQGVGRINATASTIGQEKLTLAASRLGNPIGIRQCQQFGCRRIEFAARVMTFARASRPAGGQRAHLAGTIATIAAEGVQPDVQVRVIATQPTLDNDGGDLSCGQRRARRSGSQDHRSEVRG